MKKKTKNYAIIAWTILFSVALAMNSSCKQEVKSEAYQKGIADIAESTNKKCPMNMKNGSKLVSVNFKDNKLTYRLTLSDESIVLLNLDNVRDSLINSVSDNLREYLVKGNCLLEYRYVSPNDSSSINILPEELKKEEDTTK